MFLQVCVILSTGGGRDVCLSACWDNTPRADTPQIPPSRSRHPHQSRHPPEQTPNPPSRHPLGADTPWSRHQPPLPEQTTAYGQRAAGTHPTGMHSCVSLCYGATDTPVLNFRWRLTLGFKARVSSLGSQHGNRGVLFHIPACRPWWRLESGPISCRRRVIYWQSYASSAPINTRLIFISPVGDKR